MMPPRFVNHILPMASLALFLAAAPGRAVTVTYDQQGQVSAKDTLQNVLPVVEPPDAAWLDLAGGLVDGGATPFFPIICKPQPDNGTKFNLAVAPITITWDLERPCGEMTSLSVLLLAEQRVDIKISLSTSTDGKRFTAIPGATVTHLFEALKDSSRLLDHVKFAFAPGEAKRFRYLRVTLPDPRPAGLNVQEIDADITGCSPKKYTAIGGTVRLVDGNGVKTFPDQTIPAPAEPCNLKLDGTKLLLPDGTSVLDLAPLLNPGDTAGPWTVTKKASPGRLELVMRSAGGLEKKIAVAIKDRLLTLDVRLSGRPGATFDTATLKFMAGAVPFATMANASGPASAPCGTPAYWILGSHIPYFIFTADTPAVEVHFFMPDSYNLMGEAVTCGPDGSLLRLNLHGASGNSIDFYNKNGYISKWNAIPFVFKGRETVSWRLNIAVFKKSPPTLGSSDLTTTKAFNPLQGIYIGVGDQTVRGRPLALDRSKMLFMGFKLPDVKSPKPGNQLQIDPKLDPRPLLQRFEDCGIGMLCLFSEYRDVSHGIAYRGDYTQTPPGYDDLLKECDSHGIKPLVWFSPRGFLQKDWWGLQPDPVLVAHPEWFTTQSHWFDGYRTVNMFKNGVNEWCDAKIKSDLASHPFLGGIAFDTFPSSTPLVDASNSFTAHANDMKWWRKFAKTIRAAGRDKIYFTNICPPYYEEFNYVTYGTSEHPLLMFLNDISNGRVPVGHTFVPWEYFGQLHFWYTPLGHMYYNFCDYDQGFGWVAADWVGILPGQMAKEFSHVAPIWKLIGKGTRIYGAQILPEIRQIEARQPDGSVVVVVCSMARTATASVRVIPQRVPPGIYKAGAAIDTALEHKSIDLGTVTLDGKTAIELTQLPPYSMAILRFEKP